jgi:hypothetical protein
MTLFATNDNRRCFAACQASKIGQGLCHCHNRFKNSIGIYENLFKVRDEYKYMQSVLSKYKLPTSTDYDFIYDAPLTC